MYCIETKVLVDQAFLPASRSRVQWKAICGDYGSDVEEGENDVMYDETCPSEIYFVMRTKRSPKDIQFQAITRQLTLDEHVEAWRSKMPHSKRHPGLTFSKITFKSDLGDAKNVLIR